MSTRDGDISTRQEGGMDDDEIESWMLLFEEEASEFVYEGWRREEES